jgi:hypothetical protein
METAQASVAAARHGMMAPELPLVGSELTAITTWTRTTVTYTRRRPVFGVLQETSKDRLGPRVPLVLTVPMGRFGTTVRGLLALGWDRTVTTISTTTTETFTTSPVGLGL